MKFRIKKDKDGMYFAEYKEWLSWEYVSDSCSFDIEKTREACRRFKQLKKKDEFIERFEL